MGRLAAQGLATILKLVAALAVLGLGWMVFAPERTTGWGWTTPVEPWIARVISAFPVERAAWGVLLLALGGACILAALPKSVKARSGAATALAAVPAEASQSTVQAEPSTVFYTAELGETSIIHDAEVAAARASFIAHESDATRSRLADLVKKTGDIAETEGRLTDAIEAYEESLALRRDAVTHNPGNLRELRWLWMTLETLAECRDDRGHRTQAAALYQEALARGEALVSVEPDNPGFVSDLDHTRTRLAAL